MVPETVNQYDIFYEMRTSHNEPNSVSWYFQEKVGWTSLQRTVSGQDNGLCGAHGISILEVLLSFLSRPNQWIFKAVLCNSWADLVIGLNSSLSSRTQTTFSVDNIS